MKRKKAWAVLALTIFTAFSAQAQSRIQPTTEFSVIGQVEQEIKFSVPDL